MFADTVTDPYINEIVCVECRTRKTDRRDLVASVPGAPLFFVRVKTLRPLEPKVKCNFNECSMSAQNSMNVHGSGTQPRGSLSAEPH